jgi:hypothetical protein
LPDRETIPDIYQDLIVLQKYEDAIKLLSQSVALFGPNVSIDTLLSNANELVEVCIRALSLNKERGIWNLPDLNKELIVGEVDSNGVVTSKLVPTYDDEGQPQRRLVDTRVFIAYLQLVSKILLTLKKNASKEPSICSSEVEKAIEHSLPKIKLRDIPKGLNQSSLVPQNFTPEDWASDVLLQRRSVGLKVLDDPSMKKPNSSKAGK